MAAPADYLDAKDLRDVQAGGVIREDVMNTIFDVSEVPTVFLDMARTDTCNSDYTEWTEDELDPPDLSNAVVSGSDMTGATDAGNLARVGNRTQISTKLVAVTERAQNVNTVGFGDTLAYRTMRKLQELRRDVEAIVLTHQGSVTDNNNNVAGRTGGLAAWIVSHADIPASGAANGGFNLTTKQVEAYTPGARRALTWARIGNQIEGVYQEGSNPTVLSSVPGVTKRLAQYLFTTDYVASPVANVSGTGDGVAQTAQGYIDTFRTDFGFTMRITPNRLQQTYQDSQGAAAAHVFGLDLDYVGVAYLHSYKVEPLAKLGLSHRRMLSVDYTLKVYLERAHFRISDINPTAQVSAGT